MMKRYFAAVAVLLCFGLGTLSAQAQTVAPPTEKPGPAAATDPAQIKALVQTLNDPDSRTRLVQQLNLMAAAQDKDKPKEVEGVGSRVLRLLSAQVSEAGEEFGALGDAFVGLPAAERWFQRQLANPIARSHWIDLGSALALVLAAGAATIFLAWLAIRGPRHAIERRNSAGFGGRLVFAALRLLLRFIPIGLFGAVSYTVLSLVNPPAVVNLAAIAIINATMLVLAVIALSRFLLAPYHPNLRLLPVSDTSARFLHRWISWVGAILAFGWFGISAARLLGLPRVASQAAFKIVALTVTVILVTLVIRKRRDVAQWIRGHGGDPTAKASAFWSTRRRLADIWHLLAIAYLVAIFVIWALDIDGGFDFMLRATGISVLVIAAARLFVLLIERMAHHGASLFREPSGRFPHLTERAGYYVPVVRTSLSILVWLAALLVLIDAWGLDTFSWFESPSGKLLVGKAVSIAFVLISAIVSWEFVSAVIERYLVGAVRDGTPIERSQRVRTLLPLLRNAFLIFLIVIVTLLVLSEIGLNIAPLLAGAGVVGLAIGFGAQTLVKDVITGVFILFENTIAVGDVVDVGGGHSGAVEAFSIRTLKLRDGTGGVHTVPFSNVTTVVNMTKEFAYYMFNIKVDYGQDTDEVIAAVKQLGSELQTDMGFCEMILAPLEIIGLDSFGSDAAILQARFKTRAGKQWSVGREFNRRLKKRFGELHIPLSFPQSLVMLPNGQPAPAEAPAAPAP